MGAEAWDSSVGVTWEEKAQLLGLDDLCMSALNAVHSERAHQILNDMQSKGPEIRNVSAYVNNAARKAWDDNQILRRALETDIWSSVLDDATKGELKHTDATWAIALLKDVRAQANQISDPCDYIKKQVRSGAGGFNAPMAHQSSSHWGESASGMEGGSAEGWDPSQLVTWEEKAQLLGLDELCMSALSQVHSERAHQILNDMDKKMHEIRNISAYVNNAARKAWEDKEVVRRALETDIWSTVLDDSAKGELKHVDPSIALQVLKDVRQFGNSIRNPSSYVCGTVRKRIQELASSGGYQGRGGGEGPTHHGPIKPESQTSSAVQTNAQAQQQMMSQSMAPAMAQMGQMFSMFNPMMMPMMMGAMGMTPMAAMMPAAAMMQACSEMMTGMQQNSASSTSTVTISPVPQGGGGGGGGGGYRNTSTPPPKPREASQMDKLEIDEVIAELVPDLDQKAVERVYQLGSAAEARKALEVLVDMGDEVRNKSAFINGIVNKRLMAMPENANRSFDNELDGVDEEVLSVQFQVDMEAFEEDLDDQAKSALKDVQAQMGSASAIQLLKELTLKKDMGGIRNLSGFAYKMARTRLAGNAQGQQGYSMYNNSPEQAAELQEFQSQMKHWGQELDDRAQKIMNDLQVRAGAATALEVLKELELKVAKEEIRNVSSFVYKMARQRIQGTPMPGKEAHSTLPSAFQGFFPQQGRGKGGGGTASLAWIQETCEQYGLKGRLDETALQVMLTAQQQRIIEILQDMSDMGDDVRNPSAFIQKSLKDCPEPGIRKRSVSQAFENMHWETVKRAHLESTDDPLIKYKEILGQMDEAAVGKLRGHPDQSRVRDILAEMATKILDIRNPSAFVVKALNDPTGGRSLGPMY